MRRLTDAEFAATYRHVDNCFSCGLLTQFAESTEAAFAIIVESHRTTTIPATCGR